MKFDLSLYIAAQNGHTEIVKLLLNALAYDKQTIINETGPYGVTLLYFAAQEGHQEEVEYLLSIEANPRLCIKASVEILQKFAAAHQRTAEISTLLKNKGISETIDGFSPLHAAIFFGHTNIVQLLLTYDITLLEMPAQGIYALEFALAMGQDEMIRIIENSKYDNHPQYILPRDEVRKDHTTPSWICSFILQFFNWFYNLILQLFGLDKKYNDPDNLDDLIFKI